jgi:hypothetical protein
MQVAPSVHTAHLRGREPPGRQPLTGIRRALLISAVGAALATAGCGAGSDSPANEQAAHPRPAAQTATDRNICPPAPRRLADILRQETRNGDRLKRLFAVRSNADFSDKAPAVRDGVYFVSGNIGAAVFTWAVDTRAWRTGQGLIVAADVQTRAVSPRRWAVNPRQLGERFGIDPHTDGYARARSCANPTRS